LSGCGGPVSGTSSDYSGEYVFTPHEDPPPQFADFVVLRSDGTAVEIRYARSSGQVSTTEKRWKFVDNQAGRKVAIGDFAHPIEGTGTNIRLFINYDLNEFYQKVR
jgi:hypothetical protein